MARVKITEFAAKKLLIDQYDGVDIHLESLQSVSKRLEPKINYIVKVDQGVKKRGKQGLIRLNVDQSSLQVAVEQLAQSGFDRFIAEPMINHDESEERYVSFERTRDGLKILFSQYGGVDTESHADSVQSFYDLDAVPLPKEFLLHVERVMNQQHFSFVEINPLIVKNDTCLLLDAAVLADSAGMPLADWTKDDVVESRSLNSSEKKVLHLNEGSAASFSFKTLNLEGSIWLLLSGGGASITIADEAANKDKAHLIGNYGEYSGGPTREETQLYTDAVIRQALDSQASKKALVIAGGVANFTDVKKTFNGVIDALTEHLDELHSAHVKVYVRRGGPNEAEGLNMMKVFLEKNNLMGSVNGSETVLTEVVDQALEYVDA